MATIGTMVRNALGRGLVALGLWLGVATASQATETVVYYHTDALGSPVAMTDAGGTVIEHRTYEPYGKQLSPLPPQDGPGYTGHVYDAATGLNYMQQRYYDPGIGRFLSVDPVSATRVGANFNRYWYANNNPYGFADPDGRMASNGPMREQEKATGQDLTFATETYSPVSGSSNPLLIRFKELVFATDSDPQKATQEDKQRVEGALNKIQEDGQARFVRSDTAPTFIFNKITNPNGNFVSRLMPNFAIIAYNLDYSLRVSSGTQPAILPFFHELVHAYDYFENGNTRSSGRDRAFVIPRERMYGEFLHTPLRHGHNEGSLEYVGP